MFSWCKLSLIHGNQHSPQGREGNVDSAIKLITNNMQNRILSLTDTTLKQLKQKHPKSAPTNEQVLLPDQPESIHQIKYKNINADAVRKAALKTTGGSGSSGLKVLLIYAKPLLT